MKLYGLFYILDSEKVLTPLSEAYGLILPLHVKLVVTDNAESGHYELFLRTLNFSNTKCREKFKI